MTLRQRLAVWYASLAVAASVGATMGGVNGSFVCASVVGVLVWSTVVDS